MEVEGNTSDCLALVVLEPGGRRRLASHGHAEPEWMLPVAGRRIADYQPDGIAAATHDGDCSAKSMSRTRPANTSDWEHLIQTTGHGDSASSKASLC